MSKVQSITLRFLMFVLCSVAASLSRRGNSSKVILLVNHNLLALYVCMYMGHPYMGCTRVYICISRTFHIESHQRYIEMKMLFQRLFASVHTIII